MANERLTENERIALEKQEHKRLLARERYKRYYAKPENRKRTLEAQKARREADKRILQNAISKIKTQVITPEPNSDPEPEPEPNFDNNFDDYENEVVSQTPAVNKSSTKMNYTKNELINLINNDNSIKRENTKRNYVDGISRLFHLTGCDNLRKCFVSYKKMIDAIKQDEKYKTNTKKLTSQSLLYAMDNYNILQNLYPKNKSRKDTIKKEFNKQFQHLKEIAREESKEKQRNMVYPTWDEYLGKVIQLYGRDSKHYLLTLLYSHFPVRDDFKSLKIIETVKENDGKQNYVVINRNKIHFIINIFKTSDKYKELSYTVPKNSELFQLINNWITNNNKNYGDYLFGKGSNSNFIGNINKAIGYSDIAGINAMRHIAVSSFLQEKNGKMPSFEERFEFANRMGHAVTTQPQYQNNLKAVLK